MCLVSSLRGLRSEKRNVLEDGGQSFVMGRVPLTSSLGVGHCVRSAVNGVHGCANECVGGIDMLPNVLVCSVRVIGLCQMSVT